jgi:hypothetical protein
MANTKISGLLMALVLMITALPVQAGLTDDLQELESQAIAVNNSLNLFSLSDQSCSDLGMVDDALKTLVVSVESISTGLSGPITITAEDLDALNNLSAMAKDMAENSLRISMEIQSIEGVTELFEYRAVLSAMLELSNDIGTMADRILEMADRILAMADNILLMADRILITQQIQNANIALTQASLLTTQQNMIALSESVSSSIYNLTLGLVVSDSNRLFDDMAGLNLTSENMAWELDRLEASTTLMVNSVVDLYTWMSISSQGASHYINGDTLTALGDLSNIHAGLAFSLETYAALINELAPFTDTVILSDATASMLRLTADIGLMASRIMEMVDKIIVMADNIGLMADNIVATQELQQTNIELTQSSLLSAQNTTITAIKNMGL